mgnify:CR=1 FL=1
MERLQHLSIEGISQRLDVSALTHLRSLRMEGSVQEWPQGVASLEHLERLDLWRTNIRSVPPSMLIGHERLWRGLNLRWAAFDRREFMAVYEHVRGNPAHLLNEQALVRGYCEGVMDRLKDVRWGFGIDVVSQFRQQGLTTEQILARTHQVFDEQLALSRDLEEWSARELRVVDLLHVASGIPLEGKELGLQSLQESRGFVLRHQAGKQPLILRGAQVDRQFRPGGWPVRCTGTP